MSNANRVSARVTSDWQWIGLDGPETTPLSITRPSSWLWVHERIFVLHYKLKRGWCVPPANSRTYTDSLLSWGITMAVAPTTRCRAMHIAVGSKLDWYPRLYQVDLFRHVRVQLLTRPALSHDPYMCALTYSAYPLSGALIAYLCFYRVFPPALRILSCALVVVDFFWWLCELSRHI